MSYKQKAVSEFSERDKTKAYDYDEDDDEMKFK